MAWWKRIIGMLLVLASGLALGAIELRPGTTSVPVGSELHYLRDAGGSLGLADVLARPGTDWRRNRDGTLSRGFDSAAWWLRFDVSRRNGNPDHDLLEIAYPVLDHVEAWILQGGRVVEHYRVGDKQPFASRPVAHRYFLLPLRLDPGETYTVVLRVRTDSAMQVPLTLWNERAFFEHDQYRLIGEGLYFGSMLIMVLYNFFVFVVVRERNYLSYVMYVLSIVLFLASLNGLAFQFLWPEATQWNDEVVLLSLSGIVFFGTVFSIRFLDLVEHVPRLVPAMRALCAFALLLMGAAFLFSYGLLIRVTIVTATLACLAGLIASGVRWRQGDPTARFYTVAWSSMLLGGIILALNKFEWLPPNLFTDNAAQFGSALEVVLLSFAMAERISEEKRLRFNAQQDALESERKTRFAQAEALDAQRVANVRLEQRVQERTVALKEANARLAELSATDQLTGLKNRRHLDGLLQEEFSRCFRYGRPISLLLLDIDHFKRFNDTYGHQVGDDCLRAVADALRQAVRLQIDQVARYGGEEFCVVLPETEASGAAVVADRIREAVEAVEFFVNGQRVPVTVSVGVAAMVPAGLHDAHLLVLNTDKAHYEAKAAGRNRVQVAG
ncbi:MAG: diguanylate cyclase [Pseudomonadota bacterium]